MVNEFHRILKILVGHQDERFSIRKLSRLRKVNYKSAYQAVMKLEKEGMVHLERLGNTSNCSFTHRFSPLTFAVEYERREDLIKNKDFKVIYSQLSGLPFPLIALLFGSQAKRTASRKSDIDMLIITHKKKEVEQLLSLIPLNIHPTIITYDEFILMAKSREFSVVSEAMKKNVILIGIEEYYRLLENVGC